MLSLAPALNALYYVKYFVVIFQHVLNPLARYVRGNVNLSMCVCVSVPPEWISKPSNQEVIEGEDVSFPCSVSGVPKPNIIWKKLAGKTEKVHAIFFCLIVTSSAID